MANRLLWCQCKIVDYSLLLLLSFSSFSLFFSSLFLLFSRKSKNTPSQRYQISAAIGRWSLALAELAGRFTAILFNFVREWSNLWAPDEVASISSFVHKIGRFNKVHLGLTASRWNVKMVGWWREQQSGANLAAKIISFCGSSAHPYHIIPSFSEHPSTDSSKCNDHELHFRRPNVPPSRKA